MTERPRSAPIDLTALRGRIELVLDTVDWPAPFDLDRLLDQVGKKRGSPFPCSRLTFPRTAPVVWSSNGRTTW